jgi:hypothetical protein
MCNLACSPNLPPRISHVYPASTTLSSHRRSFYNLCLTRLPCAQVGDGSGDGRESRPTVGIETAVSRVEEEGRGVRKQGEWQWPVARSEAIALRIWPSTFFLIWFSSPSRFVLFPNPNLLLSCLGSASKLRFSNPNLPLSCLGSASKLRFSRSQLLLFVAMDADASCLAFTHKIWFDFLSFLFSRSEHIHEKSVAFVQEFQFRNCWNFPS